MKIDFNKELKTIEGDTLMRAKKSGSRVEQVTATLKWACVEALLSVDKEDNLSGEEKAERYSLAVKIQESNSPLDLTAENVVLLKDLCDRNFAPLIVGQTRQLLEPEPE